MITKYEYYDNFSDELKLRRVAQSRAITKGLSTS